jgi:DNA-binding NarL/FixJ family response regulator
MPGTLIVDDHPLFREGLKAALESAGDFGAIAQAATVAEALCFLDRPEGREDLVILDISLPDGSGFDVLEHYEGRQRAAFFLLSMHTDCSIVLRALREGALGYASKQIALEALLLGLRLVRMGHVFVETECLRDLIAPLREKAGATRNAKARLEALSPRERDTFELLARGKGAKDIAAELKVSVRTVENYQSALYAKLSLASPVELVKLAFQAGLIVL